MLSSVKLKSYSPAGSDGLQRLNKALAGANGGDEKRTASHQNKTPIPWEKLVREAATETPEEVSCTYTLHCSALALGLHSAWSHKADCASH